MKKQFAYLFFGLIFFSVAFAHATKLYREFKRRDAILFSAEQGRILVFLKTLDFDTKRIKYMQLFKNNDDKFLLQLNDKDICLGDIKTDLLRCKNSFGLTTISYSGDAD